MKIEFTDDRGDAKKFFNTPGKTEAMRTARYAEDYDNVEMAWHRQTLTGAFIVDVRFINGDQGWVKEVRFT